MKDYIAIEKQAMMPTYARFPVVLERGEGCALFDTQGRAYLDFGSGIGVSALGHGDAELTAAIHAQVDRVLHVSNLYYNPAQVELAEKLVSLTGFSRVFLCNSGAEANEGAIKLARKYSFDRYGAGRSKILTLEGSFHGRTVTTLAATGQKQFHTHFFPFTEGFAYVPAGDVDALRAAATPDACAILLECIQGEGGVIPLEPAFVQEAARLAEERDLLLIIDEIQTGVGRTGTFFAFEQYGVRPDLVTMAKGLAGGLPIGAVLASEKCGEVLGAGTHGTTFGGNPVACAAASVVLERVPALLTQVRETGEYLRQHLRALPRCREARGLGLMIGADFEGLPGRALVERCIPKGLLLLTAKASVRMLPPLIVEREQVDQAVAILREAIEEASAEA